jgi:3-hydroxybutyryl-CoA dehydrogenase
MVSKYKEKDMTKNIGIIGSGIMGAGIAQIVAQAGYSITMVDLTEAQLSAAVTRIKTALERSVSRGFITDEVMNTAIANITTSVSISSVAECDLIIENIWEELEAKGDILKQLESLVPVTTILASNTSTIPITELGATVQHPERIVGMHFFNPPYAMNLVEVIRGYHTSDEAVKIVTDLSLALNKKPVTVNDTAGFVVNRLIAPFLNEASFLLQEGVATKEDIDECVRSGLNHPMGPFQLMDLIGLDITLHEITTVFKHTGDPKYRPSGLLQQMVTAGQLGRKTGSGWYTY